MLALVLQDFNDDIFFDTSTSFETGVSFAMMFVVFALLAVWVFIAIGGMWKVFTKAGEPGWHAIVPILNTYTMIKVARRPGWWLLLMLIPCVSFVVGIIVMLDLAKAFGKDTAFGLGLVLLSPIFMAILGFGSATYTPAPADPYGYGYGHGGGPGYGGPGYGGGAAGGGWGGTPAGGTQTSGWGGAATTPGSTTGSTTGTWGATGTPGTADPSQPASTPSTGHPGQPADQQPTTSQQPTAPQQPTANPPAGWYPDPSGSGQRWWDGTAWTEHHAD